MLTRTTTPYITQPPWLRRLMRISLASGYLSLIGVGAFLIVPRGGLLIVGLVLILGAGIGAVGAIMGRGQIEWIGVPACCIAFAAAMTLVVVSPGGMLFTIAMISFLIVRWTYLVQGRRQAVAFHALDNGTAN